MVKPILVEVIQGEVLIHLENTSSAFGLVLIQELREWSWFRPIKF
jgi:hypothetical protein